MTVAICLKCGAMKHGAWTQCRNCKHTPEDPEDKAKHLMTSDHYFAKADLEGISERIKSGLPLSFDPQQVAQFVATLQDAKLGLKSLGFFKFGFLAVVFAVIVTVVYLIARSVLK